MRFYSIVAALLMCGSADAHIIDWTDVNISSWSPSNPTIAQASTSLISGSAVTFNNVDGKGINFTMKLTANTSGEVFNLLGPGVTADCVACSSFKKSSIIGMNMQHPLNAENTNFRFRVTFSTPLSGEVGFGNQFSPDDRLVFGSDHWSFIPSTFSSIGGGEILTNGAVTFVNGTPFNPRFVNASYIDWGFGGSTYAFGLPTKLAGFNLDITTVPEPTSTVLAATFVLMSITSLRMRCLSVRVLMTL